MKFKWKKKLAKCMREEMRGIAESTIGLIIKRNQISICIIDGKEIGNIFWKWWGEKAEWIACFEDISHLTWKESRKGFLRRWQAKRWIEDRYEKQICGVKIENIQMFGGMAIKVINLLGVLFLLIKVGVGFFG